MVTDCWCIFKVKKQTTKIRQGTVTEVVSAPVGQTLKVAGRCISGLGGGVELVDVVGEVFLGESLVDDWL